ncbi:hypothetical protein B0I35DRAFT_515153 [Stachybotrys elegans]|uniref:NmrA-like domain-containing protein n=1 Tax=Stachybotrys elegans TaxID=80388 RepID=A0A8K0WM62_9HYPO|nr:hypothetical protein B0I35DRAFT_515153 [Stachybotrys elegans]
MSSRFAKDQPEGFQNAVRKIAIVGASGQAGEPIAKAFVERGKHQVTALTRAGSAGVIPEGVKSVQVDYGNHESLVAALRGQEVLIITMAVTAPHDTIKKLISAAAEAGIKYVMPNWWGEDINNSQMGESEFGRVLLAGVKAVEDAGLSWITMASSYWYEYSLAKMPDAYGIDIAQRKATLYDDGKTAITTTTFKTHGLAVASLFSLKVLPDDERDKSPTLSQFLNKSLYIASFTVSQRDMLDSVHRVLGTTDSDWTIDYEPAKDRLKRGLDMMKEGNHAGFRIALYARSFTPESRPDFVAKYGVSNDVLGIPKENIDDATREAITQIGIAV